jgi:transposase-like protein
LNALAGGRSRRKLRHEQNQLPRATGSSRLHPTGRVAVFRFTLSFRDVEDLLAERGIEVSYETIRQWVMRFGPAIAQDLRSRRPRPHRQWHLDEMFVSIGGKRMYLWRALDAEGEVLDCLVQSRRDTHGN